MPINDCSENDSEASYDDKIFGDNTPKAVTEEVINKALNEGKDIRQYSKEIDKELRQIETESLAEYIKNSSSFVNSYKELQECDKTLGKVQNMLESFQQNLEKICSDIQDLQEQSRQMKIKLKNRQDTKCELSQLVDEIIISEDVINTIMDVEVSEAKFQECLHELHHKLSFVQRQCYEDSSKACMDVSDVLEKLKQKAIGKIKDFLLRKIYSFRKPMTNYQVPQSYLLKYRFFYEFLLHNDRHTALQIKEEYLDTMSKILYAYFKDYYVKLTKLQFEELPTKDDLIGVDESKKGRLLPLLELRIFSKSLSIKDRPNNVFTLGDRGEILSPSQLMQPIIVPHISLQQNKKYPFERIFRSINYTVMENGCREAIFLSDFFLVSGKNMRNLFDSIWGKVLNHLLKSLDTFTFGSYDALSLLICVHLIYRFMDIERKREMNFLQPYWASALSIVWSRFVKVVELNVASVKNLEPHKLETFDLRPHYITRRYSEFFSAILMVNQTYPTLVEELEEATYVSRLLQSELENFVLKMAAEFYSRKEQLVFLINNYDLAYSIILEKSGQDCKESETIKLLLGTRVDEFAEEILAPYFGGIIALVKEIESSADDPQVVQERLRAKENLIRAIIKFFNNDRSKAIEAMNQEIMQSFTNFKNGTNILQAVLSRLIQYYHRFLKILNHPVLKNLEGKSELINTHNLMVEIKKYKPNF